MNESLLIIDDDTTFAEVLARSLRRRGYEALTACDGVSAQQHCQLYRPGRIILDLKLERESGLSILTAIKALLPEARIIILTGYSSIPTTVEAIKLGAINYLCKPASVDDILSAFEQAQGNPQTPVAETPHSVERLEWEHIQRILKENDGNISATARALGMHRRTLQRKLQKKPVRN